MNRKSKWIGILACGVAIVTIGSALVYTTHSTKDQVSQPVSKKAPEVVKMDMLRYKAYDSLEDLKKDTPYVVVGHLVKKKDAKMVNNMVSTENDFHVDQVMKGDKSLKNSDIVVNETGGLYQGKLYEMEEND